MARAANGSGTWSTASIWDTNTNTATLNASTNVTLSTSDTFTAAFTAPNTTNASTGISILIVNKAASGSPTTLTATLQEATVDTAHTVTITLANVDVGAANGWVRLVPASPYVFTATTANRYRWKLKVDSGTVTVAQSSTGGAPAYWSWDDRHSVPTSSDPVQIIPKNEDAGLTVTFDSGATAGGTTNNQALRSITTGIQLDQGSILAADTAASTTLTQTGGTYIAGGCELRLGTVASPYPSGRTCRVTMSNSAIAIPDASSKLIVQGNPLTNWKSTYASGAGTAASPMITAGDIGSVGDEVLIGAASDDATNYDQTESRFIITKNSDTSYVLSLTSGGAEAALTYTHAAGADIVNVQYNVVLAGASAAAGIYIIMSGTGSTVTAGNYNIDWARFDNVAGISFLGVGTSYIDIPTNGTLDNCVAYGGDWGQFRFTTDIVTSHTGLIGYSTSGQALGQVDSASFVFNGASNLTMTDCFCMGHDCNGFALSGSFVITLAGCKAYACGAAGGGNSAGFYFASSGQIAVTDIGVHASRVNSVYLGGVNGLAFSGGALGTLGESKTSEISCGSATFNNVLFDSVLFGSPTFITGTTSQTVGSELRFHRKNATDDNHEWYTIYGRGFAEATITRSPGLAVGIEADDATTGFTWDFQIPVTQNSLGRFFGWFLKDTTLGTDDVTVSMYLPDNPTTSGVPDVSVTLNDTTGSSWSDANEQFASLVDSYTGDKPGVATVFVNVKSTSGGILYADDFFNAGDRTTTFDQITGLNTWVGGKPIGVIQPSVPSAIDNAQAVWDYLKADATTTGTMGKQMNDILTTGKFIALK